MIGRESLVERGYHLRSLERVVAESTHSGGAVLLSGEAGFGKTSLLRAFTDGLDHKYRVLTAACEPVGIPAAFAPLFDLLDELPEEVRSDVRSGSGRPAVYAGMLDLLKNDRIILILEDLHWADEASLGLVRYLGRRIGATNSCLIATFRSEELALAPLLRLVVADLGPTAERIELPPLTLSGVVEMARGLAVDPVKVHAATLGNPFFVEEVIRHPDLKLPPTVGAAVLASAGQLPKEALQVLYMVALSPEGVDLELLTDLGPGAVDHLDMAVQRRLLVSVGGQVTCRHDLIRESLLQSVPPGLKRNLHGRFLAYLEQRAGDAADVARLAYHGIGAGNPGKALSYSIRAARDAAKAGAHRLAAFHYSNALDFRAELDEATLNGVLLDAAKEHCLVNAFETATELARQRLELARDAIGQARARAWLAFFKSRENDLVASRAEAQRAVGELAEGPPFEELAVALSVLSWVENCQGDYEHAVAHAEQAAALAREVGSVDVEVNSIVTSGTARLQLGDRTGMNQIEAAARLGIEFGAVEAACRALSCLGGGELRELRLDEARRWFDQAIEYTAARELDAWYIASVSTLAWIDVAAGRWDEADHGLEQVLGQRTCTQTEIESSVTAATLRLRRGDPGPTDLIQNLLIRTDEYGGYDALVTVCALLMEAAWVGVIDSSQAIRYYQTMSCSPALADDVWGRASLAFWARRLGLDPPQGHISGPAGLEWAGQVAEAAREWEQYGFPVEAAITAAMLPDADLDSVFSDLTRLGAEGVARGLRRELQRHGVRGVPRGERAVTKENPAGLTVRQAEVLALIASGLSNAEIAERLFITEKTASHHVSAVLTRLNVSSRLQAAALANTMGWFHPVAPN